MAEALNRRQITPSPTFGRSSPAPARPNRCDASHPMGTGRTGEGHQVDLSLSISAPGRVSPRDQRRPDRRGDLEQCQRVRVPWERRRGITRPAGRSATDPIRPNTRSSDGVGAVSGNVVRQSERPARVNFSPAFVPPEPIHVPMSETKRQNGSPGGTCSRAIRRLWR